MKNNIFRDLFTLFIISAGLVTLARWFHPALFSQNIIFILTALAIISAGIFVLYE